MSNEDDLRLRNKIAQITEASHAPENGPMQRYFVVLALAGIPGLSLADIAACLRTSDWDYFILMAYSPYSAGRESAFCRIIDLDNQEQPTQVTLMPGYQTTHSFIDQGHVHTMSADVALCNGIIERRYYLEDTALSLKDLRTLSASKSHDLVALNELNKALTVRQRLFFHMGARRIIEQEGLVGPLSRMQRGYLNPEARMVYTLP